MLPECRINHKTFSVPKFTVAKREIEDFIDILQLEITSYLSTLSRRNLSDEVSNELPVLLHTVNDLERIGLLREYTGRRRDRRFLLAEYMELFREREQRS